MPKMIKTVFMATVDFDKLRKNGCAWDGCKAWFEGDRMPEGWRSLMLFWAPLGITDLLELDLPGHIWDRDCVLCPKHAGHLHQFVLKDIGQRLKDTEGSA